MAFEKSQGEKASEQNTAVITCVNRVVLLFYDDKQESLVFPQKLHSFEDERRRGSSNRIQNFEMILSTFISSRNPRVRLFFVSQSCRQTHISILLHKNFIWTSLKISLLSNARCSKIWFPEKLVNFWLHIKVTTDENHFWIKIFSVRIWQSEVMSGVVWRIVHCISSTDFLMTV